MIGIRTALILYAVLVVVAVSTMKGNPLYLALIIVLGLAAKSIVQHLRSKIEP